MDALNVAERLSQLSRQSFGPLPQFSAWPEALLPDTWCMPRELSFAHATCSLEHALPAVQKRLSFFELINFFSLNIHGERALLAGLSESLYSPQADPSWAYLHHFIDEENKHMQYFAAFCLRYAGKIYPERKLVFPRDCAPGEAPFLFFAKVLLFEEAVDYFNVRIAADPTLPPIVRDINAKHHDDEVRHLAFGRMALNGLHEKWGSKWSGATRASIRDYLLRYTDSMFREYANPLVYTDAGLFARHPDAFTRAHALADDAFEAARGLRFAASRRARVFFAKLGVFQALDAEDCPR